MNTPLFRSLLQHPLVEVTGWTLLHFVWQGILIALAANFALSILRRATPQSRYLLACSTLTALILAPVVTAGWLFTQSNLSPTYSSATVEDWRLQASPLPWSSNEPRTKADSVWFANENRSAIRDAAEPTTTINELVAGSVSSMPTRWLHAFLPGIVGTWCCGVALLSIRLLAGLCRVWQWKRHGTKLTDVDLVRRTAELATRMGIRDRFQLLQSTQAAVPAVIGWLRPAVIVPTSLITGMSPQELESLLAHELAHIRRHDYLVNLWQTVVETLLFYHPAVWWISGVMRAERENCCDDVAAVMCGDRIVLAKALARMEELRCHAPGLAMSARNGSLLHRIRRILLVPESHSFGWWPAGLISMTGLILGVGSLWLMVVTANENLTLADSEQRASAMAGSEVTDDLSTESTDSIPQTVSESNEEKILATHTYDLTRRESTGWIEVEGVGMPIDAGAEALGIRVHVTLMQTLVAIDISTGKVLWHLDEGKQSPTWRKISILELPEPADKGKLVVVELGAADGKLRRRFHLRTGEEIVSPLQVTAGEGPKIQVRKQEGDRIQLATIDSSLAGRTKTETIRRFQEILMRSGGAVQGGWVTDQETLVSAERAQMLKPGPNEPNAPFDAQEVIFNLPEGSGTRAEFAGEKIEITTGANVTKVVVTNGRVKLFDSNGVERADASPDGGAEQLVVDVRKFNGEGQLKLRTRRIEPDADYPQPPVQVKCNLATGALADERQPPHGAVRFGFEYSEDSEPIRMKMRWHYDLQRLVEEAELETGRQWPDLLVDTVPFQTLEHQPIEIPPPVGQTSKEHTDDSDILERARALGDWLELNEEVRFDSPGFMRLAAELMALDQTQRVEILRAMASERLEGQTIVLCRMLFEARPGREFRRPFLGDPDFIGTESKMENWPLEPITLVNGVPLLIVSGYILGGEAETAVQYLDHCLQYCDWTKRSFNDIEGKLEEAERTIRQPTFWHEGLGRDDEWRELGGLLKQLRPGFMIGIKQQPHYNAAVPVYLLDLETRVEPNNVVQELNNRGCFTDTTITFVLNDNATPEWIEQILKPILAAGFRNFEFIRWQQTIEPVSIPELDHMLDPIVGNPVRNNRDDPWGALAAGSGLQSRLTLTTEKPSVGIPLLLKLELKNPGEQPAEVNLQAYAPFRVLRVEGKQADGSNKSAPFIGMTPQTEGSDQTLAPGQVITVWENVDAATLYLLDAGPHQIFAKGGAEANANLRQDSNRLQVNLQPGQPAPQQVFLGELLKILPEGWTLSTGFGAVFLSHSPTDLKADTTTIQLWFTDEKLPIDYELGKGAERQIVGLVGQTDLGYLNIGAVQRAAELWPEYARDVKIAAAKTFVFKSIAETPQSKIDDQSNSVESGVRNPWRVFGLVTDAEARPIAGATV